MEWLNNLVEDPNELWRGALNAYEGYDAVWNVVTRLILTALILAYLRKPAAKVGKTLGKTAFKTVTYPLRFVGWRREADPVAFNILQVLREEAGELNTEGKYYQAGNVLVQFKAMSKLDGDNLPSEYDLYNVSAGGIGAYQMLSPKARRQIVNLVADKINLQREERLARDRMAVISTLLVQKTRAQQFAEQLTGTTDREEEQSGIPLTARQPHPLNNSPARIPVVTAENRKQFEEILAGGAKPNMNNSEARKDKKAS